MLPAIRLLEKNVAPHQRVGPWSLKARDLMEQADARLTAQARRAWRWRILLLRARIDAQLYVNRGIGTVGLPFRLNCPPEITLFTLQLAEV